MWQTPLRTTERPQFLTILSSSAQFGFCQNTLMLSFGFNGSIVSWLPSYLLTSVWAHCFLPPIKRGKHFLNESLLSSHYNATPWNFIWWYSANDHIYVNETQFTLSTPRYHLSFRAQLSTSHGHLSLDISEIQLLTFLRDLFLLFLLLLISLVSQKKKKKLTPLNLQNQSISEIFGIQFYSCSWSHHLLSNFSGFISSVASPSTFPLVESLH